MSEKKQITSMPAAMVGYADYVDPRMVEALRPNPAGMEFLFGPRPKIELTRRQRLMFRIGYRMDRVREAIALKIAPWLEGRE